MEILAIDHIHFYVENLVKWQNWFGDYLQFFAVEERQEADRSTVILRHGQLLIYLSAPRPSASCENSAINQFLTIHGEGIGEIGFLCSQARSPLVLHQIKHLFLTERSIDLKPSDYSYPLLFSAFDHLVVNVPQGALMPTAQWYRDNLGLLYGDRFDIHTDYSGLTSLVLHNDARTVQIPINQPTDPNSQIQHFLDHYSGPGIQHMALRTDRIEPTIQFLLERGLQFLRTEPLILVENQSAHQSLHQIFTKPIFGVPTFFWEIIERRAGAIGFGAGNFQSLFEAIENQQRQYAPH